MAPTNARSARPGRKGPLLSEPRRASLEWLIWAAIALVAILQTGNFDQDIADYAFGADGWPLAVCIAILIGATLQLGFKLHRSWTGTTQPGDSGQQDPSCKTSNPRTAENDKLGLGSLQTAAIFLLPFAYLFLAPRLGFYLMTPVFIACLLLLMQVRSIATIILVTAAAYGIALIVFTRFLYVALPVGRVEPFYSINNAVVALVRAGI